MHFRYKNLPYKIFLHSNLISYITCYVLLQIFLDELHASGRLNSTSLWKDLYPIISVEERYRDLLGQPGIADLYS